MPHYIEPTRCGDNFKFVRRHHHHSHHHGHHHGHGHEAAPVVEAPHYKRCRPDCAGLTTQQWAAACAREAAWAAAYEGVAQSNTALRRDAAGHAGALAAARREAAHQREANQALLGENARLCEVAAGAQAEAAAAQGRAEGFRRRVRDQRKELDGLRAAHAAEIQRRDVERLDLAARQSDLARDKRRAEEAAAAARADAARLRQRLEACRHCRELRLHC